VERSFDDGFIQSRENGMVFLLSLSTTWTQRGDFSGGQKAQGGDDDLTSWIHGELQVKDEKAEGGKRRFSGRVGEKRKVR